MDTKEKKIQKNLMATFAGETQTRNCNRYCSPKAKKERYPQITAYCGSETQVTEMDYDESVKNAERNGDKTIAFTFSQAKDIEVAHSKLSKKSLNHIVDESETTYHVCMECGYISDCILPDQCPMCKSNKEYFFIFSNKDVA